MERLDPTPPPQQGAKTPRDRGAVLGPEATDGALPQRLGHRRRQSLSLMEHRVQDTRRDRGRLLGSRRERGADCRLATLSFHRKYSTLFSGLELLWSCFRRNGKDGPL